MPVTFERSPDTDAVIMTLNGVNLEISYRELAQRSGLSIGRMKSVLGSARRVLATSGILFGCIHGEGLKRLTDADKIKKPEAFKRRVFRGAGREMKHLKTITNYAGLSKVEQHSYTLNLTVLHAMRQSAAVKPDKIDPGKTALLPLPAADAIIQMGKKNRAR